MKKLVLIFSVFFILTGTSFGEENILDVAARIYTNSPVKKPYYQRGYQWGPTKRLNPFRNGVLTGFSPPVYNPYIPQYQNCTIGNNIRRFFNPNFNNHYMNSPYYNPYQNGVYTNVHSNGFTQLFSNPIPSYSYNSGNSFDLNGTSGLNTGATVTIID